MFGWKNIKLTAPLDVELAKSYPNRFHLDIASYVIRPVIVPTPIHVNLVLM